jgi:hypothetical protein
MDQWLYREGDLVLGPVPAKQLVDKLYQGELGPTTEVQALGSGSFRRIAEVADFRLHVAKAEAKRRVDETERAHHQTQRRRRSLVIGVVSTVLLLVGIGVAAVGRYLAVHSPATKTAEELAFEDITFDAPTITRAQRADNEELMEYPGATKKVPPPATGGTTVAARDPVTAPRKNPDRPSEPKPPKPKMGQADSEGLQVGEVDQNAINDVIARHRAKLVPCIRAVAKPGMVEKIPIEFSITDTGKVSKVWVDNPNFKTGPLPECLLKELQNWPFKASPSGGATVNLSFNIGNAGKRG